ncbi:MAG: hypothetical protein RLZZ15_3906, partial [Verrucomicrobiota bacterium]
YLAAPGGAPGARRRLVALLVFPAVVWLVTAPLLTAVESRLSAFLFGKIVRVVLAVFHALRLPIELQGNLFIMRGGPVGIDEACLGLRSITGCVFGGLFLAEVCLRRWRLRAVLVGAALAFAVAMNLARVLFLNLWAYKFGPAAIEGFVHDAAGWAVLGLTATATLALAIRLERVEERRFPAGNAT